MWIIGNLYAMLNLVLFNYLSVYADRFREGGPGRGRFGLIESVEFKSVQWSVDHN